MKSFKIKVYNPDISKIVQEKLFSLGYQWWSWGKNVGSLHAPCLFVDLFVDKYITYGVYDEVDCEEITINQLMEMEPEQSKKIEKLSMDHDCGGQQMEIRDKINQLIDDINKLNEKIDI